MTLLRAMFVLLATWSATLGSKLPWRRKLSAVACETALAQAELHRVPILKDYELFLLSFRPWRHEGAEIVGRAKVDEWRVDLKLGRMKYIFPAAPGVVGQLAVARRVARAGLAVFSARDGLQDFRVHARGGRVTADVPLTEAGLSFIIDLANEADAPRGYEPLPFARRRFDSQEYEEDGRTKFKITARHEPRYSAFALEGVARWLDDQRHLDLPAGLRFDPVRARLSVDLASPRGAEDLLANARRVAAMVVALSREGAAPDLNVEVLADDTLRVHLPWSRAGVRTWRRLEGRRHLDGFTQPVETPGLTPVELAMVSDYLEGLFPRVLYVRRAPEHFLKPPEIPPPTAAEAEAARQISRPGEVLPRAMLTHPTLERAEMSFAAFGPWADAGEGRWTARGFGVRVMVSTDDRELTVEFADPAHATSVRDAVVRAPGRAKPRQIVVDPAGARLTVPLGPTATRVLLEVRATEHGTATEVQESPRAAAE